MNLLPDFAHYETDTDPGSSGSPVYNDQWEVVALHHSGVPGTDAQGNLLDIDGGDWRDGHRSGTIEVGRERGRPGKQDREEHQVAERFLSRIESAKGDVGGRTTAPGRRRDAGGRGRAAQRPPLGARSGGAAGGGATFAFPLTISVQLGNVPMVPFPNAFPAIPVLAAPDATATQVVPGFHGVIVLELVNAGTIPLELRHPIAQIVFQSMTPSGT